MKDTLLILVLLLFASSIAAGPSPDALIHRLDEAIAHRDDFIGRKQFRIDSLKGLLRDSRSVNARLDLYEKLYREYLTFNYDSTMAYVARMASITRRLGDHSLSAKADIHRALSLATAGHFSNAMHILDGIDSSSLPERLKEEYFAACEWTYGVWAEYSEGSAYEDLYKEKSLLYLDSLIDVTAKDSRQLNYRLAEKDLRLRHYEGAKKKYLLALKETPPSERLYAQAAYALAQTYKDTGDVQGYEEWLIKAAIADQSIPLKENLALQQLALYLKENDGDLNRANRYLKIALDDAIFYNNRLRMLDIAEKIPDITNVYQEEVESKNRHLTRAVWIIGASALLILALGVMVYIEHRKISNAKKALSALNDRLRELNLRLSATNGVRERYTSLFMDLCVAYIDKLNRFPLTLKLKVKNMSELNSVADKYIRPSEAEMREMFFNFDSAFLRLYPDFIKEFNALLRPDCQILPKKGELLCTDLRIYALVRMGIEDSNKIATLMFLSPQTIFNHRTQVRNRAIDRATFESSIASLCATVPE